MQQSRRVDDQAFERPLRPRPEVSLSIFGFFFSEVVQQILKREKEATAQFNLLDAESQARAPPIPDLEKELFDLGKPVGQRILELQAYRDKGSSNPCSSLKRELKIVNMLHYINNQIWKALFGRPADGLEQSVDDDDEYRILDKQPITNKYVSQGKTNSEGTQSSQSGPNSAAFLGGIIEGVLHAANMDCKVSWVTTPTCVGYPLVGDTVSSNLTTVFVIKFAREVAERDTKLN